MGLARWTEHHRPQAGRERDFIVPPLWGWERGLERGFEEKVEPHVQACLAPKPWPEHPIVIWCLTPFPLLKVSIVTGQKPFGLGPERQYVWQGTCLTHT